MSAVRLHAARGLAVPERPVRILGVIGEPMNGVSYIRFVQPFSHLEPLGFRLNTLGASLELVRAGDGYEPAPGLLDEAAVVMFPQLVASPRMPDGRRVDLVRSLCDSAARAGRKVVYSVDDHVAGIETRNPGYDTVAGALDNLHTLLDRADAIIVTTPELEHTLSPFGKPIHLLPNAVDPSRWNPRPRTSGELRIGWTGSSSHIGDLLMVVPAIRRLQRRLPCRFFLQGLVERPLHEEAREVRRIRRDLSSSQRDTADAFLELVGALEGVECVHVPFGPVDSFFELLPGLDLDIGICPLLDTPFNRHKSANKFYEYAVTGTTTVASAVTPYLEEVSVTVDDDVGAWCDALEQLLGDPAERDSELERQRAFVLEARNIETLRFQWADALTRILGQENTGLSDAAASTRRGTVVTP